MGLLSKDIEIMDDLFVHTLRDIYCAERQIQKNLPELTQLTEGQGMDLAAAE